MCWACALIVLMITADQPDDLFEIRRKNTAIESVDGKKDVFQDYFNSLSNWERIVNVP